MTQGVAFTDVPRARGTSLLSVALVVIPVALCVPSPLDGASPTAVASTLLVSCVSVVLLYRTRAGRLRPPLFLVAFLFWAGLSALWNGLGGRGGLQTLTALVVFTGVVTLAASDASRLPEWHAEQINRGMKTGAAIVYAAIVLVLVGVQLPGGPRVLSLTAAPYVIHLFANGSSRARFASFCGLALVALTLSRTALAALAIAMLLVFVLRTRTGVVRRSIVAIAVSGAVTFFLLSWPAFSERVFSGDTSISIGGLAINANGRSEVWNQLIEGAHARPYLGHGPGSSRLASLAVSPSFDHPHNDFIKVLYEFGRPGLVALVGFLLIGLVTMAKGLTLEFRHRRNMFAGGVAVAVYLLIAMATDNPLAYVSVLVPVGVFLGSARGELRRASSIRSSVTQPLTSERRPNSVWLSQEERPPPCLHE